MSSSNIIQANITAGTAVIAAGNILLGYALAHAPGMTTERYTLAGGVLLDEAAQLLTEKQENSDEYIIPAKDRVPNHARVEDLSQERIRLNEEALGFRASLMNWSASRSFYQDTFQANKRANALSGRFRNKIGHKDGEEELNREAQSSAQFPGYRANNNRSEQLPPPLNSVGISPSIYKPQLPEQTGRQRLPSNANGCPQLQMC